MILTKGTIISQRYELQEQLGRGGFSVVWRARQIATDQSVAIKFLRPDRIDNSAQRSRAAQRFESEMRLMARVRHTNIVQLIDSDQLEDGQYYTVMKFVEGEDLGGLLRRGRLTPPEAKRLMLQVLDALGAAHHQHVIHRDLKPQNIMITTSGVRRNAVVVDFGIATLAEAARGLDYSTVTAVGEFPGTVYYMAPESLKGAEATAAVDIYAWALVFLECLVGARIVTGKNAYEVIHKHTSARPIPIPEPLSGHPLGHILRRALHKDPAQRYQRAAEVVSDLEPCLVHELDMSRVIYQEIPSTPEDPTEPTSGSASTAGAVESFTPAPVPQGSSGAAPEPATAHKERSQLTYLACGLIFSGLNSDELPVDEMTLLSTVHERWERIVDRFAGRVERCEGGRLLATFGLPQSREDDGERAVLAARHAVDTLHHLPAAMGPVSSSFKVQAGIHSGLVVVHSGVPEAHHLRRSTPSVAIALQQSATPGSVVMSQAAVHLLRGRLNVEKLSILHTISGPTQAYRLLGPDDDITSSDTLSRELLTPFVGREAALATLNRLWQKARASEGVGVLVAGEAGLGKTRLAMELCRQVTESAQGLVLELSCAQDAQNSPLRPIIELLHRQALTGALLRAWLKKNGVAAPDQQRLLMDLAGFEMSGESGPRLPPPQQKRETIAVLNQLAHHIAAQRPLLLWLEDVHWADPTTLEWLVSLVQSLEDAPILLLMTQRPSFTSPWEHDHVEILELGQLSADAIKAMVDHLTAERPLPAPLKERIVSQADRVPLYVEQVVRAVIEGDLDKSSGMDTLLPSSVRLSITARLNRLGPPRITAHLASVIGRNFDPELLAAISEHEALTLDTHLSALKRARLIQLGQDGSYRFCHALVQETAYDSINRSERADYHRRLANTLIHQFPEIARARPGWVAQHFASAQAWEPAVDHAIKAAHKAQAQSASKEALALVEQGIEWLTHLSAGTGRDSREFMLRTLMASTVIQVRGYSDPALELSHLRCRELAPGLHMRADIFPNLWGIWVFNQSAGRFPVALEIARENLAFAQSQGNSGHILEAHLSLATTLFYTGELAPGATHMSQARDLYRREDHHGHAFAYGQDPGVTARAQLAWNQWFLGRVDKAEETAADAIALADELGHVYSQALARGCRTFLRMFMGDVGGARLEAEAVVELSKEGGIAYWELLCSAILAWAQSVGGDGDAEAVEVAVARFRSIGVGMLQPTLAWLIADAHLKQGNAQAALTHIEQGLAATLTLGERFHEPELHRLKAEALHQLGESPDVARAALDAALVAAVRMESRSQELRTAQAMSLLPGHDQAGLRALRRALGRFTEGHDSRELQAAYATLDAASSPTLS